MNVTYKRRRAEGICTACGFRKARPGMAKCIACAAAESEYQKERYWRGRERTDLRGPRPRYLFRLYSGSTEIFSGTIKDLQREYGGTGPMWHHYADVGVMYRRTYRVVKEPIGKENRTEETT